jgi:Domain of unknown function (DUF4190)
MPHNGPIDDQIQRDPHENAQGDPEIDLQSPSDTRASDDPLGSSRRCGSCGCDLTGASADSYCHQCGKYQGAPRCTFCGYELTGLQVTQSCPECGKPIWDSNIQPPTSGLAIASMVVGITSIPSCMLYGIPALILGPLAIIFGEIAIRQYRRGYRAGNTKGFALTGRICGWISFTLTASFLIIMIIALINT